MTSQKSSTVHSPFVKTVMRLFAIEIVSKLLKYSKGFNGIVLIMLSSKFIATTFESPEILSKTNESNNILVSYQFLLLSLTLAINGSTCY